MTAAVHAARQHGIDAEGARLIYSGANAAVDLVLVPVVARVMTITADVRGERALGCAERDLAIAKHLQSAGAVAVAPSDLLPPDPIDRRI